MYRFDWYFICFIAFLDCYKYLLFSTEKVSGHLGSEASSKDLPAQVFQSTVVGQVAGTLDAKSGKDLGRAKTAEKTNKSHFRLNPIWTN